MTLYPTSIRAKLTLMAVLLLGVLFVLLGGVVQVAGRQQIMARVDSELLRRATEVIQVHQEIGRDRPPPADDHGPGLGPEGGPDGRDHHDERDRQGGPSGPGGPDGRGGQGGPPGSFNRFRRRLREIGDPTQAIGPRFIAVSAGPPIAPPEMMQPYDEKIVPVATKRGLAYSTVTMGTGLVRQKVRIVTKLATDDDGRKWLAQIPYPLGDVDGALDTLNRTLLVLLPIGLFLTAIACLFLMQRVMRPIREITATADSIGAEDLSGRLKVAGSDEFAHLGNTINGMLGRLENAFVVQRHTLERLEAILKQQRRFTADASHELKTPLAVIKANTGLMLHSAKMSADTRSSIESIDAAATRMNRLVQGLMLLARTESGEISPTTEPFDLKIAVQNAIDQVHRSPCKVISYADEEGDLMVSGTERDVERVFVNLIDNACRHTRDDGHVDIHVNRVGSEAVVTVSDDGEGVGPEHLPHLFDRFYRVDSARSSETGGTGLGLAICKGIVEGVGGTISIESELGVGTRVSVRLPIQ